MQNPFSRSSTALAFGLSTFLLAGAPRPILLGASAQGYPPYVPVATASITPADLLVRQARWIRNQVWTSGDVADASAYLFPKSYDTSSGFGILGTDYFSWMLDNNEAYRRYDLAHNDHKLDVPLDASNDAAPGEPFGDPAAVPWGFFLQGTTGSAGAARGNTAAFATDVQTWGIAAILGDRPLERELEQVYGPGFLDQMFDAAIGLGGYYRPDAAGHPRLAGIGFSAQAPGDPAAQMSGEWTWGAVNAAIVLADFHREPGHADPARVKVLLARARDLIAGADRYCSHDYNPGRLPGGRDWVGYLYANARQWIPWGWWSNACPSQAATAWAFRVNAGFDSFALGGGEHQATVKALGLAGGL